MPTIRPSGLSLQSVASCRDQVALNRLNDSTKMWGTLKQIAQAELAHSSNQAPDSVTLRFLSLAPRVARLNKAVHDGLAASGYAAADAEGAGMTDSHAQRCAPAREESVMLHVRFVTAGRWTALKLLMIWLSLAPWLLQLVEGTIFRLCMPRTTYVIPYTTAYYFCYTVQHYIVARHSIAMLYSMKCMLCILRVKQHHTLQITHTNPSKLSTNCLLHVWQSCSWQ